MGATVYASAASEVDKRQGRVEVEEEEEGLRLRADGVSKIR